jgi:hypothetical protein
MANVNNSNRNLSRKATRQFEICCIKYEQNQESQKTFSYCTAKISAGWLSVLGSERGDTEK